MAEPTTHEQHSKPSPALLNAFPKMQDFVTNATKYKTPVNEEPYDRPLRAYSHCSVQQFALELCSRNMTKPFANVQCWKEKEDFIECRMGRKRVARAQKLKEASRLAGDRVPEIHGNQTWTY